MFDPKTLLDAVKDPATGLQILAVLVALNAFFGVIVALKLKEFDRDFLLNFLRTRILEQLFPVAVVGFLSMVYPWTLAVYLTGAGFMVVDLGADLIAKMGALWSKA